LRSRSSFAPTRSYWIDAVKTSSTSLLIAVGVALETMKQVDGQLMTRNYDGFLKM
jgi:preprotein translocase subunit SecY